MKKLILSWGILFLTLSIGFFLVQCNSDSTSESTGGSDTSGSTSLTPTDENLKVAFFGDQGLGANPVAVLQLIEDEGADMVIHLGDFDYTDDPDAWDAQITSVLGENFPYFSVAGNHDVDGSAPWDEYQQKIEDRIARITDATCTGDAGVQMTCVYKGLYFILSGVGTKESTTDHEEYLTTQLSSSTNLWRICAWHKNQQLMQVGGKTDEVGWEAYEICRENGAIIATGHEHSYSRTFVLSDMDTQTIYSSSTTDPLDIDLGRTFAFVSGLGGHSIRTADDTLAANPWWASIYSADESANYGALFCTFFVDGVENKASCYFKDIDGNVPDSFEITNSVED